MKITVDGRRMTSKEVLHAQLKEQCGFPEDYGNNLDALYDLLTSRSEPLEISIIYAEELKELLCGYGEAFLDTLRDAEAEGCVILEINPAE